VTVRTDVVPPQVAVPAYFHPAWAAGAWAALVDDSGPPIGLVVLNPASGVGAAPDAGYRALCDSPRLRSVLAGYVDSAYATRPIADVVAEAVAYRRFYGITAIFVDQVTSGRHQVGYYRELGARLGSGAAHRLVLNPGVQPHPEYFSLADVVVTFEGPWAAYRGWTPSTPAAPTHRAAAWHLVHSAPVEHHATAMRTAAARGARYAYVTERRMPNPWDELPASWHDPDGRRPGRAVRGG
jgi:hypothetical protein